MKSKPLRTCIQIGIWRSAELGFLADPDLRVGGGDIDEYDYDYKKIIPYDTTCYAWHYLGVDLNPTSITRLIKANSPKENMWWLAAYIGNHPSYLFEDYCWSEADQKILSAVLTPDELIKAYLKAVGAKNLDILALDIEGGEYTFFDGYSWDIQPKLMIIEDHDTVTPEIDRRPEMDKDLSAFISSYGYKALPVYEGRMGKIQRVFEYIEKDKL